jgi:ADP-heptose:LPS heptosyltransferase
MQTNVIFQIDGGIGKSIMATAVCEAIKKQYPQEKLIVITAYPEVFLCNPHVDKCLSHNNLNYFYQDYVENKKVLAFLHNPYQESAFIERKKHLIELWCEMFGVKYNGEKPKLYLTQREIDFYSHQFVSEKPIFVIQTNGGAQDQAIKYSWSRDIPNSIAQKVVDSLVAKFHVVHIRREDQLPLQNTTPYSGDFRSIAVLIKLSQGRLFMDSFAHHVAQALDLNSVVLWIANTPNQFGYKNNSNIIANAETFTPELKGSVFSKYNIVGQPLEFPFNDETEIFNEEDVIENINNLFGDAK